MNGLQRATIRAGLWSLQAAGVPRLTSSMLGGMGGILAFHRVHQPRHDEFSAESGSIAPQQLRDLVQTLLDRGYDIITLDDLLGRVSKGEVSRSKFACLTFDDGFTDSYTEAFPICREYNVPMTVFLVTGAIYRRFPLWGLALEAAVNRLDQLEFLLGGRRVKRSCRTFSEKRATYRALSSRLAQASPDQIGHVCRELEDRYGLDCIAAGDKAILTPRMIAEMAASGLVQFGAHGVHHARLATLPDELAYREIDQSKRECEALIGAPIRHFSYPYGDATSAGPREFALCRELGFASAVTTISNTVFPRDAGRLHALPRLTYNSLFDGYACLDLLLSGALPALRRRWDTIRAPA